jgi:hypothetical protein
VEEYEVVLSVGDTTFLDYGSIKAKREGYLTFHGISER